MARPLPSLFRICAAQLLRGVVLGIALAACGLAASEANGQSAPRFSAPPAELQAQLGPLRNWLATHAERNEAEDSPIQTDRPSFTASHLVVPKGWAQLESGYQYTFKRTAERIQNSYSAPQLNLRLGLTDWMESRTLWNGVETTGERDILSGNRDLFSVSANLQTGFKFKISNEQGLIPQSALITTLFLPTGTSRVGTDHVAPQVDYIYYWTLSEKLSFTGSTGAVFAERAFSTQNEYFQSLVLGADCSEKVSLYWEWYVTSTDSYYRQAAGHNMDGGILWKPRKNIQFDWRAGFPVGSADDSFFTGVGFSARY